VNNRMWILTTDDAAVDPPVVIRLATGAERTVGRANRSDFILDAALVSRVHCRLSTDAGATSASRTSTAPTAPS